jgi:hypothetical protein
MIAQMFSTDKRFIGKEISAARRPLTPAPTAEAGGFTPGFGNLINRSRLDY